MAPDVRGRGIAGRALELVTRWAFEDLGVARAQLITDLDNGASQRVAEKCGFRREGVLRAWEPIGDGRPDVVMFARLPGDELPER